MRPARILVVIGPGLLVAATGVGAGDLATAAFAGGHLGMACLWAVLVGAVLKFTLTEGLARWQLATGETLIEGAVTRLGWPVRVLFPLYLLPWSLVVGAALMSACGVCAHALLPVFDDPVLGKIVFGLAHSALGAAVVLRGGFGLFERMMQVCVGAMFLIVVVTAVLLAPDWGEVWRGLSIPSVPQAAGAGPGWIVALVGGVGGTLTVLCYGYWIRERGRDGPEALTITRVDLAVGYFVTAVFGLAMVILGSTVGVEGSGEGLIVDLAQRLEQRVGPAGRWAFLVGSWGAVFSSLLGVWQAVPYIFADFAGHAMGRAGPVDTRGRLYRGYLLGLATLPALGLAVGFERVQQVYAVVGALFLPLLAVVLLMLVRRRTLGALGNGRLGVLALWLTLAFFVAFAWLKIAAG